MRITPLIAKALLCIAGPAASLASAQTEYDWAIQMREYEFGVDQKVSTTTKRAVTDIRTRITRVDTHTLEVTIVSLKMSVSDTPMDAMEFDSAAEPDPESTLDPELRPLVGESYSVTYDPQTGLIKTSGAVIEMAAAKAIALMTSDPWIATTYMPFFVGAGDERPEFMVLPMAVAKVWDGEPSPIEYILEDIEGVRVLDLAHNDTLKGITEGPLSELVSTTIMFRGTGRAEIDADVVRSYSYVGETVMQFDSAPKQLIRGLIDGLFTMAVAPQEANAVEPAETESEASSK